MLRKGEQGRFMLRYLLFCPHVMALINGDTKSLAILQESTYFNRACFHDEVNSAFGSSASEYARHNFACIPS